MAQSFTNPTKIAYNYNAVPIPAAHVELADQTVTTNGTLFAAQNHAVAGLQYIKARVRVKGIAVADNVGLVLKVSTTSAMTSPETVAIMPTFAAATTDVIDAELMGFSQTGYQFSQISVVGLTATAHTITADVIMDGYGQ